LKVKVGMKMNEDSKTNIMAFFCKRGAVGGDKRT
jgi:hypothetical protein